MYSKILKDIANNLESIRVKIYQQINLEEDKQNVDDKLFSIQHQVREIGEIVSWYEDDYDDIFNLL